MGSNFDQTKLPTEVIAFASYPIDGYLDAVLNELQGIFSVRHMRDVATWEERVRQTAKSPQVLLSIVQPSGAFDLNVWRELLPFRDGREKTLVLIVEPEVVARCGPSGDRRSTLEGIHDSVFLLAKERLQTAWIVDRILHRAVWQVLYRQGLLLAFEQVSNTSCEPGEMMTESSWSDFLERVRHLRNRAYVQAFAPIEPAKWSPKMVDWERNARNW
jgi:hypothetical protein